MAQQADMFYRSSIDAIRASKVVPAVALMHLRHGFSGGHTCGECSALGKMHVSEEPYPYCLRSQIVAHFNPDTPACGKFRQREADRAEAR